MMNETKKIKKTKRKLKERKGWEENRRRRKRN